MSALRRHGRRRVAAALLAVALAGCARDEEPARPAPAAAADATVVARLGGAPVTAADLDRDLVLPLHDLDLARHALRAQRLHDLLVSRVLGPRAASAGLSIPAYVAREAGAPPDDPRGAAWVAAQLSAAGAEVLLEEPEPPVVAVSADDDPVRGPADAPVTIVEFLDFQSPWCARMQPVLLRVLASYPDRVRLVVRDLPLPLHRDAARAAAAAQCAAAQGRYWPLHDVLLQEQADLGRPALARYAARAGLDADAFAACLDGARTTAEVAADAADARRLGLTVVPTFFVDGRYLKGPQTEATLRRWVERALAAKGLPAAPASTTTTAAAAAPPGLPVPAAAAGEGAGVPPPASTVTLDADLVRRALGRRGRLARDLDRAPADLGPGFEGHRMVRVRRVRPGSLYEAMGLRDGDVVLVVDDQLVLDRGDVLFDALRDRDVVTVRLLRRGLPVTYEYRVGPPSR